MALTKITTAGITAAAVTEPKLAVSGTGSSSNFLRGDMSWATVAGDIESVVAGTGLNGGGSSGDVTLNVDAAQTTITSLASNVVISTSGAITTTGAFTSVSIDDNGDAKSVNVDTAEKWQWSTNGVFKDQVNNGTGGNKPWVFCNDDATTTVANCENMLVVSNGNDTTGNMSGIGFAWLDDDDHPHFMAGSIQCVFGARTSDQYPTGELAFLTGGVNSAPSEKMRLSTDGEVGIGTASPGKQLHITKSAVADLVALTDASTIAVDFDLGQNLTVTLAGNRALGNPTNVTAGQTGSIFVTQDGTGGRTLSYGTSWEFPAATAPTLTTTAAAVDRIDYIVKSSTSIQAVATLAYA